MRYFPSFNLKKSHIFILRCDFCPVTLVHWIHCNHDKCSFLDMYYDRNESSVIGHWTKATPFTLAHLLLREGALNFFLNRQQMSHQSTYYDCSRSSIIGHWIKITPTLYIGALTFERRCT